MSYWQNEELNEAASDYVRANAVVKGRPNMTKHIQQLSIAGGHYLEKIHARFVVLHSNRGMLQFFIEFCLFRTS